MYNTHARVLFGMIECVAIKWGRVHDHTRAVRSRVLGFVRIARITREYYMGDTPVIGNSRAIHTTHRICAAREHFT